MNYEGWEMMPARDIMYPIDYHERYGYMYPSMQPEMRNGMMYPDMNNGMYPDMNNGMYPDMNNGMMQPIMYPDIYYRLYPYVHNTCNRMDNPYMMYPSEAHVENMVNDCYDNCVRAMPDLYDYAQMQAESHEVDAAQLIRRRPILRDLIAILLISELFRRRHNRFNFGFGRGFR